MGKYPWLDKPIEQWTWKDVRREMARFGFNEIDKYANDISCNPNEAKRRFAVLEHTLNTNSVVIPYFWEHQLRLYKHGGEFSKKRGRLRGLLRCYRHVMMNRIVEFFH